MKGVVLSKLSPYLSLVKFSHTIFALPFAFSMLFIVMREQPVHWQQFFWILIAMISARTAAMAFNRIIDRKIDALNSRTANRELPKGVLTVKSVWILFITTLVIFHLAAAFLGKHSLLLAPLVAGILCFYSYTKRFTSFAHMFLGLALALAPGGVWYALTAQFSLKPLLLMAGVLFWVAGFDILYSCQDLDFDRKQKLYSMPVKLGSAASFNLAKTFHFIAIIFFLLNGVVFTLGGYYYLGLLLFSACLLGQYFLVSPDSLDKIDQAFFNRNAQASLLFFLGVFVDFCYY